MDLNLGGKNVVYWKCLGSRVFVAFQGQFRTYFPLLLLPGRVEQHVPVPVVLLEHVLILVAVVVAHRALHVGHGHHLFGGPSKLDLKWTKRNSKQVVEKNVMLVRLVAGSYTRTLCPCPPDLTDVWPRLP